MKWYNIPPPLTFTPLVEDTKTMRRTRSMVHGKNRIPYRIDQRLTCFAGPEYDTIISYGLPFEPEDSQYGKSRLRMPSDEEMVEVPEDEAWTLQSNRLVLSPMVRDDADDLFGLLRDPVLRRFTGGAPPTSADDLRERIHVQEGRRSPEGDELWLNWTLRLTSSGQAVGYVQAGVREGRADLAWVVGVPFQNRGYATEAGRRATVWIREHCGVSELRAAIHPDHVASCRVAAHIGLRPSGELTDEGEQLWTTRQE